MTVPPAYGVLASGGGVAGASFINAGLTSNASTAQALSFPSGTQAGDLALIYCWQGFGNTASISGGAGGWTKNSLTWTNFGYFSAVFNKVLAAGDLGGVTVNAGGNYTLIVLVYRGATTVTVKSTNAGSTSSSLALTGFTKNAACKGIVTFACDRDPSSNPTVPTGFATRAGPGNGAGFFTGNAADILTTSSYTNGSTVTWTGFVTPTDQTGYLIELT